MRTQDNFNLDFESGQSFAYQDTLNNATVTVKVVSGSLVGSGSFNANNNGGSLAVAPLTAGVIQINATKPIYLYYNSQYLKDSQYSYAVGYQFTLTWTYITPLPTPSPATEPTPLVKIFMWSHPDPTNWIYVCLFAIFFTITAWLFVSAWISKLKKANKPAAFLAAVTAIVGIVTGDLAHDPPSNFQTASLQSVTIFVYSFCVVILGIYIIYKTERKLSRRTPPKKPNHKQGKEGTNNKSKLNFNASKLT